MRAPAKVVIYGLLENPYIIFCLGSPKIHIKLFYKNFGEPRKRPGIARIRRAPAKVVVYGFS
jgi:hypothetical protein